MNIPNLINSEKFKGIRKGYSAIFLGEYLDEMFDRCGRIRIFKSDGKWEWDNCYESFSWDTRVPCWLNRRKQKTIRQQVEAMIAYDEKSHRETIFLGYVKEN